MEKISEDDLLNMSLCLPSKYKYVLEDMVEVVNLFLGMPETMQNAIIEIMKETQKDG